MINRKSILIIRCGALGDLVYATSVIDALKAEFGEESIIDFVCTPGSSRLFENDTRVHKIFELKHKKIPIWLSKAKQQIIRHSKQSEYDLLINFEFGKQFSSLVEKIKAKKKIGALAQDIILPAGIHHMVEITKFIFKEVVSQTIYDKSFPRLLGTNKEYCRTKYSLHEKYIIISPSNSHQKKNRLNYRAWHNHSWIELIDKLSPTIQVVIIGNKNEDQFFDKLKPYPNNVVDLVGKTSLSDLDGALALVATDTGTAHMASAVNTEVFALIGPTPANSTGPYQSPFNKVHIISAHLPCSPCYKTLAMKECKDNLCMKEISVSMVLNEMQKLFVYDAFINKKQD